MSGISFGQHGLSIFRDERLLLNTNEGLVILDLASGMAECPTSPTRVVAAKALSNGAIAVVRHHGVAVINDGHISVRAGPFGGRVTVATAAADANLVVFSNDTTGPGGENERFGAVFAVLGGAPGEELVTELEYPPLHGFNAIQLSDGTILVLGNPPDSVTRTGP